MILCLEPQPSNREAPVCVRPCGSACPTCPMKSLLHLFHRAAANLTGAVQNRVMHVLYERASGDKEIEILMITDHNKGNYHVID